MLIKALSKNISRLLQTVGVVENTLSGSSKGVTAQMSRTKESGILYFVVYKFAPMKVENLALWVDDLEKMRQFYLAYFNMVSSEKQVNDGKESASYSLSFSNGKNRVELMNKLSLRKEATKTTYMNGIDHFAISVGDKETVDRLTERLRAHSYAVASEPKTTGELYESTILDPEGNNVRITAPLEG